MRVRPACDRRTGGPTLAHVSATDRAVGEAGGGTAAPGPARSCLVLGGTGLVGGHLLRRLSAGEGGYAEVRALSRRAPGSGLPRVRELQVDFAAAATYAPHVAVDDVFCALGTTIKKAGSREAFRWVDLEVPLALARATLAAGARRFVVVTAVGADAGSAIFYNRVKGELENALRQLPFPRGLALLHPSVLLGERGESRPAERFAAALLRATRPVFAGGLTRYRAIEGDDVARAMIAAASAAEPTSPGGAVVYEGASLFGLLDARS